MAHDGIRPRVDDLAERSFARHQTLIHKTRAQLAQALADACDQLDNDCLPVTEDDPDNDGFSGSLFIVGHRHHQLVAEVDIPAPVISERKSLDDLRSIQQGGTEYAPNWNEFARKSAVASWSKAIKLLK